MAETLTELDTTRVTTPVKNWLQRKGNALKAGFGNKAALRRHNVRLVANKLFGIWQHYAAMRRKTGIPADMGQFIDRVIEPRYGQYVGDEMRQDFPELFPNDSAPQSTAQDTTQQSTQASLPVAAQGTVNGQQATQATPAPATSAQPTEEQKLADMKRFQGYQRRFAKLLPVRQDNAAQVLRTTMSMLRDFSGRDDAAKAMVRTYIDRNLKPYASVIPELGQLGSDPFANAPHRRTRAAQPNATPVTAQPTAAAAQPPAQPTAQPANLNIPTPPRGFRPDMRRPPEFLRRQRNESQQVHGRRVLVEAPADLNIPQPPPGTKQRMYRSAPNMAQPPAFLQRQRNQPASVQPPSARPTQQPLAQPTQRAQPAQPVQAPQQSQQSQQQTPMSRAMVDRYLMGLADILLMHGGVSVGPRGQETGNQGTRQQQASSQRYQGGAIPRQTVNGQALLNKLATMTTDQQTIASLSRIVTQNPNPSVEDIINGLKGTKTDRVLFKALLNAVGQY